MSAPECAVRHLGATGHQRIRQVGQEVVPRRCVGVTRADQQPHPGGGRGGRRLSLLPRDGQQPVREQAFTVAALASAAAHPQSADLEDHLTVSVQHLEVRLDRRGVGFGDRDMAVEGVAARPEAAQSADTQRQQQTTVAPAAAEQQVCTHGLEAGIQHCGVDAVARLLGPDTGRRPDLGQQRGAVRRGMHAGQTGEGGTELDAPRGQRQPDLLATDRARVRGQQTIEIAARRLEPVLDRVQGRGRAPDSLPGVVGLHGERRDTGRIDRRDGGHSGLLVKQQHLFERNVADLGRVAERSAAAANAISQ